MAVDVAQSPPRTPAPTKALPESIWRAPLVPVALAVTAGIVADRLLGIPFLPALAVAALSVAAAAIGAQRRNTPACLLAIVVGSMALAAAYHHWRREVVDSDDIGYFATPDPHPVVLRGVVDAEPLLVKRGGEDELRSFASKDGGKFVLQVTALRQAGGWQAISGRAQVHTARPLASVHVGDEVELVGKLSAPGEPANPGEFDYAAFLRDQGVRAVVSAKDVGEEVVVVRSAGGPSPERLLGRVRGWGQAVLTEYLPAERHGVVIALLLGDGAPMTQSDWDKYIRTGVIHVLAISGQHLVVLAGFLGVAFRLLRVRLRPALVATVVVLLAYGLLVGGRPPVMRSVVAVSVVCGALFVRRPLVRANTFALSWLVVAALNPTDLFNMGCQLSFLAVAVLVWGTRGWGSAEPDPLASLVNESRPYVVQVLLGVGKQVAVAYAITLAIWVVVAPLVAARQNVLSLSGLAIGPPTVLLTSIALLSGFALLFLSWCPPLAVVAALVTDWSLAGCEVLVGWATTWPGGSWFVPNIPEWWLWVYYPAVLGLLMLPSVRRWWGWCSLALAAWLLVGLASGAERAQSDELRCTFLAVGHGGCVVLETPDGRTALYDVGSLGGPETTRRHIAPYLWHRSIRRIDEVYLSHADLDHFNGLAALLERFAVGQVTCTPTFQDRQTPAVQRTLAELERRGVPVRIVSAGHRLRLGAVELDVLHPQPVGPEGKENFRSLVLLVRHAGHSILLTGDLEGPGTQQLLARPRVSVDVLMAPHHGNEEATLPLAAWAKPKVVIGCQSAVYGARKSPFSAPDSPPFLGTWPHGAITIRSRPGSLTVETFTTGRRFHWNTPAP
jgi:competence protein ComEC